MLVSLKEIIDMANALQLIPNTPKGKAVSMALKALEQTRWIPVSERLPEDDEEVLCFLESEEMAVLFRRNNWGQYEWVDGGFATGSYDVIAWIPLPEPYKAESEVDS